MVFVHAQVRFALIGFSAYIYATQGMLGFELTENGSNSWNWIARINDLDQYRGC